MSHDKALYKSTYTLLYYFTLIQLRIRSAGRHIHLNASLYSRIYSRLLPLFMDHFVSCIRVISNNNKGGAINRAISHCCSQIGDKLWLMASVCSYGGLQGARNRDCCAVATQGVPKRNPCWRGWRPAGGRGQCSVM